MSASVDVSIWKGNSQVTTKLARLPLEIGRQKKEEPDSCVMEVQDFGEHRRLVICPLSAVAIPREAVRVEIDEEGTLRLHNVHKHAIFYLGPQQEPIAPGDSVGSADELTVQLAEGLGIRITRILSGVGDDSDEPVIMRTLSETPMATMAVGPPQAFGQLFDDDVDADRGRAAVDLVRQAVAVVQKSSGSNEFFDAAVRAAATMVQLDRAFVLLRNGDEWEVRARFETESDTTETPRGGERIEVPSGSRLLLKRILEDRQTVIYEPNTYTKTQGSSMIALDRAVAAPILDAAGEVSGVLYGDRKFGSRQRDTPIGDLEAALLEVMAGAVSAGLARQHQEQMRASMTQFFSPSVTERLEHNEDLLSGRDAEVSVLFCDIRGFSGIAERVGPQRTIQWINDVLTVLSRCVMRTDGVLVDYVGDELMAMWGAPAQQDDHAIRACTAARDMLAQAEPLRRKWSDITPERFGFGIGINTGIARVGNTGSAVKFKYGPLGNTVNVASRVQGMTKKFGVRALVTQATVDAIAGSGTLSTRRLATVRPVGVREPLAVHQLLAESDAGIESIAGRYEAALESFHRSDLTAAARELATLVHEHPDDRPSVVLLGRVVDAITHRVETVDPVLAFDSK